MNLLRTLPKVDTFIKHPLLAGLNSKRLMDIAKNAIEALRKGIQEGSITAVDEEALALHVKQKCALSSSYHGVFLINI